MSTLSTSMVRLILLPAVFDKLELDPVATEHRRVLAVLAYLRDSPTA